MNKKMIGIFVGMLLISSTAFPVVGELENMETKGENIRIDVMIQPPEEWNTTFGGSEDEVCYMVHQTADGGYILIGATGSYAGNNEYDVWLIKTDASGNEQWNKTYGGPGFDLGVSIRITSDGGYILAGFTESFGAGETDAWLIKTDASGNEQWNKTFGGAGIDYSYGIQLTSDGGYIVLGYTASFGAVNWSIWLIKTDASGNEQWNKTYGASGREMAGIDAVHQTSDGGYIVGGYTESYGAGSDDAWLIKTDASGDEQWNKTYGGIGEDWAYAVQPTTDGGYIITGYTESFGAVNWSLWLIKTDASGNEQWNKSYGGVENDFGTSVQETLDGGYIVTGETITYGAGNGDVWLIKTDSGGNEQWNQTYGGTEYEVGASVQQLSDGAYIIAGFTVSYGAGETDTWLIKIESENQPPTAPNIEGQTYGKNGKEYEYTITGSDPNGDTLYVTIDWGDNTSSGLLGPYDGSYNITKKHKWDEKGEYTIKAGAKDPYGWGPEGTLEVTMPKNKLLNFNFNLLSWLFERFPKAFPILRQLLGR